jgi:hypothetical protein
MLRHPPRRRPATPFRAAGAPAAAGAEVEGEEKDPAEAAAEGRHG